MSIRNLLLYVGILIIASGCSSDMYMNKLVPGSKSRAKKSPYGAYIELTTNKNRLYQGEYLALTNDSLYIMLASQLVAFHKDEISNFNIVLSRKRTKLYLSMSVSAMVPSLIGAFFNPDWSTEFGILGLATVGTGLLGALIESAREVHVLQYPYDFSDWQETIKYSRFPAGLPPDLDLKDLNPPVFD